MAEIQHDCPVCGADCAVVYGCGWEYDYVFCPACGYEAHLATTTLPDDLEHPDDVAARLARAPAPAAPPKPPTSDCDAS